MDQHKQIKIPLIIGGLVLVITLGLGLGVALAVSKNNSQNTTSSSQTSTNNTSNSTSNSNSTNTNTGSTSSAYKYKDGSYTATGSYRTPEGTENISVTVQIKNDLIQSVSVVDKASDKESKQYNSKFISGISGVVVGKSITSTFAPRVVNGASLTINGFDKALATIRSQAQI